MDIFIKLVYILLGFHSLDLCLPGFFYETFILGVFIALAITNNGGSEQHNHHLSHDM